MRPIMTCVHNHDGFELSAQSWYTRLGYKTRRLSEKSWILVSKVLFASRARAVLRPPHVPILCFCVLLCGGGNGYLYNLLYDRLGYKTRRVGDKPRILVSRVLFAGRARAVLRTSESTPTRLPRVGEYCQSSTPATRAKVALR